jgi:hypothetical protein
MRKSCFASRAHASALAHPQASMCPHRSTVWLALDVFFIRFGKNSPSTIFIARKALVIAA